MAYHSITIGERNTWDHWKLIPSSRPFVAPPKPKTKYVEIPGMDGSLDYSNLFGSTKYEMRTGSWDFILYNEEQDGLRPQDWAGRLSTIMNYLQGAYINVILEDDPAWFYTGRVWVSGWDSGENYSTVTIEYSLDPHKRSVSDPATLSL